MAPLVRDFMHPRGGVPGRHALFRRRAHSGSVLLASVVLMTIAGLATTSWLLFINEGATQAQQTRNQTLAFYGAEAGIERVVDYFNNPGSFDQLPPAAYEDYDNHPARYALEYAVAPAEYGYFEPYILDYAKDGNGAPVDGNNNSIWDDSRSRLQAGKEPIVTRATFYQNLAAGNNVAISLTSKMVSMKMDLDAEPTLEFQDDNARGIARVVSLETIHPSDMDAAELAQVTAERPILCKVVAVGERNGVFVTVESVMTERQSPFLFSPAAIISENAVEFSGNFNVYWGEVWASDNIELSNDILGKIPRLDPGDNTYSEARGSHAGNDPWFRMRTEGVFQQNGEFADGRDTDGFAGLPISRAGNEDVYFTPYDADFLVTDRRGLSPFTGLENLKQNGPLNFPSYDYDQWKKFFIEFGLPYFWTDTNGNIYGRDRDPRSPTYQQIISQSYEDWFHANPTDPDYHTYEQKFAFIDSVPVDDNGNPAPIVAGAPVIDSTYFPRNPDDPRAILATVNSAGRSLHTRGVMLAAANLDMRGQGNPPDSNDILDVDGNRDVLMPDGSLPPTTFDVFHNGLLYTWGTMEGGGNRTIYGSVYAEAGYGASGTPSVYYNARMKDGSWLNVNQSRVERSLWIVKRGDSTAENRELGS